MFAVYGGSAPSDILRKYNYFFINGFYYIFTMRKTISAMTVSIFITSSVALDF
jgi:hypothetical protein